MGVAVLLVRLVLGAGPPADPLAAFRGGLVLVIAFFAAAAVVSAVLLTRRPDGRDLEVRGRGDQDAVAGAEQGVAEVLGAAG